MISVLNILVSNIDLIIILAYRIDGTGISSGMEQALLELHGSREGLKVSLEAHSKARQWRKEELEAFH